MRESLGVCVSFSLCAKVLDDFPRILYELDGESLWDGIDGWQTFLALMSRVD